MTRLPPEDFNDETPDSRTRRLLGEGAVRRLAESRVLVVGVGGVGGYAVEMLARTGVGHITVIDADMVAPSNLNRQIIALRSTVGEPKVTLFKKRIADINPDITVDAREEFLTPEGVAPLLDECYDYVIDAIDTVAPKVALLAECLRRRQAVISSMGAGGRIDPSKVAVTDLWQTAEDGLARAVRQRLKKLGLKRPLKVVASTEAPASASLVELNQQNKRTSFGTTAIVPSTFGIHLAAHVLNNLIR